MRLALPGNVLSGAAFRSALIFLLLFVIVAGAAGYLVLRTTYAALDEEIRAQVIGEVGLLRDAYIEGGQTGLVEFVKAASYARSTRYYLIGLFAANGDRIAGNDVFEPEGLGWVTVASRGGPKTASVVYLVYSERIGDMIASFGRPVRPIDVTMGALWRSMWIAGLIIVLGAILVGYGLSLGVSTKLARMADTLDEVARGNDAARLPVSRANDQIDRVARQMNRHLGKLSELLAMMRNTAVAIAHDLKTPMSRTYLLLQQATDENDADRRTEMMLQAQGELESLNAIFESILRISRIESSLDQSSFTIIDLPAFAADITQTYEPVVEAMEQRICFVAPDHAPPPVFGDRQMISQLLVNLIENASRYCPAGALIQVGVAEQSGGTALFVSDTGPGIPPDRYEDVLKPFFRLQAERERAGSGLGLALVKVIASRHHAAIALSDNHPGLKVTLRFPPGALFSHEPEAGLNSSVR
jgi:signal transduction histidine kinase